MKKLCIGIWNKNIKINLKIGFILSYHDVADLCGILAWNYKISYHIPRWNCKCLACLLLHSRSPELHIALHLLHSLSPILHAVCSFWTVFLILVHHTMLLAVTFISLSSRDKEAIRLVHNPPPRPAHKSSF